MTGPQEQWLERVTAESGNFRAAMRWLLDRGGAGQAAQFGWALWNCWWLRSRLPEAISLMEEVLASPAALSGEERAMAALVLGMSAFGLGNHERGLANLRQAYALRRDLGDRVEASPVMLEDWDLLHAVAGAAETRYAFRHALVQEVAYETLLKRERARLHQKVGEAMERLYPDQREGELAGVLAYHFEHAADHSRARDYLTLAGRHALRRFAVREARAFLDRAAALLPADQTGPDTLRRAVEINLIRVAAGYTFIPFDEDLALAEAALPLAVSLADPALLAEAYYWIAKVRHGRGDSVQTTPQLQEAIRNVLDIGTSLRDGKYEGLALVLLADADYASSDFVSAIVRFERALPLLVAREEFSRAAPAAGLLAISHAVTGDFARAEAVGRQALEWGRLSGDPNALLDAHLFMGRVEAERGNLMQALNLYRQGVSKAEETGNTLCATVGNLWLGAHHIRMGRPELGVPALEKSGELAQFCNMVPLRGVGRAWLGAVYYERGEVEKAAKAWEAGLQAAEEMGDRLTQAEILRQRAIALAGAEGNWVAAKSISMPV